MSTPSEAAIEHIRHSLAHLLAAAVTKLNPRALPTIGPAIENGFYYDFDFSQGSKLGEKDLSAIESEMQKLLPLWTEFSHRIVSSEEARDIFKENPFKKELIDELEKNNETITLYKCGDFEDLCRGGHTANPSHDIDPHSFKLDRLAGAYWRGDEKNAQLTRIYGLAFASEEELKHYLAMREEAEKRDHKKLGAQLDLFVFSDLVGSGLPLWTPKGTLLRNLLNGYVWDLRSAYSYDQVEIPHITKKDLYEKSGHWAKYSEELFKITTREAHEFAMKPMNCPHHTQIYARRQWSYRQLPQRYGNTTMCYRDEQSGELSGIARARAFTQDDAHIFCRMSQVKQELLNVWNIVHAFYTTFGFSLKVRLSLRDPGHPEKYLGNQAMWKEAEALLREVAQSANLETFDGLGEAAFYGPKLDFMTQDSLARQWQLATIQLDMNMPERFDLTCVNEEGQPERIVMIHAAIMGSIERFLSILIEHFAGAFPLWLSPVQVAIIPVGEKFEDYAIKVFDELRRNGIRCEVKHATETLGKRIRETEVEKIPYALVVGEKEETNGTVSPRHRAQGNMPALLLSDFLALVRKEIAEKKYE